MFEGTTLVAAGFPQGEKEGDMRRSRERSGIVRAMARAVHAWAPSSLERVVVELPQIYPRGHHLSPKAGTDPNDLLHLAAVVGALGAIFSSVSDVVFVLPFEWKGQVPKKIHHERALSKLSPNELLLVPKLPASKLHNVLDGIALGLHDVGRLG